NRIESPLEVRVGEHPGDRFRIAVGDDSETRDFRPQGAEPSHRDVGMEGASLDVAIPGLSDNSGRFLEGLLAVAVPKEFGENVAGDLPLGSELRTRCRGAARSGFPCPEHGRGDRASYVD